jgi:hypothetical protein
MLTKT